MGRDGGWPGIQLSDGVGAGADGIIYIVTPVRALSVSLALRDASGASHFLVSSFVFHLSAFTCTYSYDQPLLLIFALTLHPHLHPPSLLALFAFHVRLQRSFRFMRSLSIFHDSMFYCLYESFYPAFLLARDISLRSVTFYA